MMGFGVLELIILGAMAVVSLAAVAVVAAVVLVRKSSEQDRSTK